MKAGSSLLGLWLLVGCATADEPAAPIYSPSEVLAATKQLDGRGIAVRGWIGGCGADDNRICGLFSSRRAAMRSSEWPLPIDLGALEAPREVRQVLAHGTYVVTCQNTETTICVEYDGHFQVASIED